VRKGAFLGCGREQAGAARQHPVKRERERERILPRADAARSEERRHVQLMQRRHDLDITGEGDPQRERRREV
jgi:hypothetical protein